MKDIINLPEKWRNKKIELIYWNLKSLVKVKKQYHGGSFLVCAEYYGAYFLVKI